MERILFIVPPHISFNQFVIPGFNERIINKKHGKFGSVLTDMPLGVMALSAYVKKYSLVETKLLDFNVELNKCENFNYTSFRDYFKDMLKKENIIDFRPDIIGISILFTPAYKSMLDIAEICRDSFFDSIIIAGGSVPTNLYEEIFSCSSAFDALCYGEGEKPLLQLINSTDKYKCFEDSLSWITKKKISSNKKNFKHDFVQDLDEIPFYDYDICNTDDYGLNPAITANVAINEKKQNFHLMTSRGCTFHCSFCASHTVHGRKIRYNSLDRVKKDLERLKKQYKAKTIIFQDDHLLSDKQRTLNIIDIINDLHLNAVFQNGLALYALDKKMLLALKSAGLDQIVLSVESGSERVLKEIMHKPLNLSIVKRVADDCRELKIYTLVNILIGLPGETKQDIEDARSFLKTINANWFLIFCATPLVGSEMFKICIENNYFNGDYLNCDYKKAIVETEDFTTEYIQEMAYFLNLELNFVENSDFKLGNYELALKGFENAIKAKDDHIFAYYYASKCYERLGDFKKSEKYMDNVRNIYKESSFWRNYMDRFNINV